jgi:hypothetical protein
VIDSAPALIHTARPDGYLDFFNRTWLDFVGQPLKSLLGWQWTSWIHPEENIDEVVKMYALVNRIRRFASGSVLEAAKAFLKKLVEKYGENNMSIDQIKSVAGTACRSAERLCTKVQDRTSRSL